jgi:hypothetical protein
MRRTRLPSLAVACLLVGLWGAASCILNPQPEPPGDNDSRTDGGLSTTGGPISGSGGSGTGTTGGGPGTGGSGGSGGSGISGDASSPPVDGSAADASITDGGAPNEASADAPSDATPVDEAGGDGRDVGPNDSAAEASDADATAVGSD